MSTGAMAATEQRMRDERRWMRLLAVVVAALAGLAVWVLAESVLGLGVRQPAFGAAQHPQALGAPFVFVVSAFAALAGWGLLAPLERFTVSARRVWTAIAAAGLLLSLGAQLSGDGVTTGNRLTLVAMHLGVGAVVITLLRRSSQQRSQASASAGGRRRSRD